ncbi:MAG TPA: amidohydrolase family protein [Pyrinomonadaceae bacterium]
MRSEVFAILTVGLAIAAICARAQNLPGSKKEVAQFVRYDSKTIILDHVRVIDGTGSAPKENQTIVISNGRIASISSAPPATIPNDATRLNLEGRTVMPGLVMLHEHMFYFSGFRVWHSQAVSYPRLYLAAGVTTLRTAGTDVPYTDLNLKLAIDEGRIAGPKMFVTGPFFNGYEGHFLGDNIVRTEADARRGVAYWASEGVTSVKVYANITLDALKGVIEEAHAHGLKVTGHLESVSCRDAATLGIDNIEHSFGSCAKEIGLFDSKTGNASPPDEMKARDLIHFLVEKKVVLTSTPSAADRPISQEELELINPISREQYLTRSKSFPTFLIALEPYVRKLERDFVAAGGTLVVGSDPENFGKIAGYADERALELLVEAGWNPMEVIRMATLAGADFLGVANDRGSIAIGKAADLIVTNGNPATDIKNIEKVELVFKDGVAYDPHLLRESVKGLVGWH